MKIQLNQVNDTKIRPEDEAARTRQQNIDAILSLGKICEGGLIIEPKVVNAANDKLLELIKTL